MSSEFYQKWKAYHKNYFEFVFDEIGYCDDEIGGANPQRASQECQRLSDLFAQCHHIIDVAARHNIDVDYREFHLLDGEIERLKDKVQSYAKPHIVEDTKIWVCKDRGELDDLAIDVEGVHTRIREYFIPLFLNVISDYQKDIASVSEQIREARNLEVIHSLSSKFKSEAEHFKSANNWFIGVIIVTLFVFFGVVACSEINQDLQDYQIVYFYLKRFSILMVFAVLLTFLFGLRKENFSLAQEYRHKEVLASSFINFQEQIDKMPEAVKEKKQILNTMLFEEVIRELGKNPAVALAKPEKDVSNNDAAMSAVNFLSDKLANKS